MYDLIVIGGGAAGMIAAIEAATADKKVLIVEQNKELGKKLLATGNGRCNLANSYLDDTCYRGDNLDLITKVISNFGYSNTIEYFKNLGIYTTDINGYIYPRSKQASTIRNALVKKIDSLFLEIKLSTTCTDIKYESNYYVVNTNNALEEENTYTSTNILLATGSNAAIKPSNNNIYTMLEKMGHHIIEPLPALVGLRCDTSYNKKLSGIRASGLVSLYIANSFKYKEYGEIQFTGDGLSGIVIFNLSRYAVKALKEELDCYVSVDFLEDYSNEALYENMTHIKDTMGYKTFGELLEGYLPDKLASDIIRASGFVAEKKLSKISNDDIQKVIATARNYVLYITGYNSLLKAQASQGGVDLREVTDTMESKVSKGLYIAGELLDVDGKCGGYNLMWAWATGYIVGTSI